MSVKNKKGQDPFYKKDEMRKSMSVDDKIIEDYLRQKDVAPWFRGTSMFHVQGSNMLLNALRDDAEQRTTHRIRSCLNLIGLEPMITSKQITTLMRLSRGNDLAFLWFLMEMHYKTPKPGPYSVNEQLICSAISHLDTITTLRELDKILPEGHPSRRVKAYCNTSRKKLKTEAEVAMLRAKTKPKYVLPYFEKIRRPEPYGEPLTLVIPSFKVNFDNYKDYKDPNYIVHNESNRWYGNYDFNAGRRITFSIIRETIGNLFENFESASLKAHTINVLCDYHKTIKEMELNLERELKVKTRDKCLKQYFGTGEEKKKRAQHVKQLLDQAIERQLNQFRREANTLRKEMTLKAITSDCDIFDVMMGAEFNECCSAQPKDMDPKVKLSNEAKFSNETPKEMTKNENILGMKNKNEESHKEEITKATGDASKNDDFGDYMQPKCQIRNDCGDAVNSKSSHNANGAKKISINSEEKPLNVFHVAEFGEKYMRNYDYGNVAETPTPSQTFFQQTQKHQPYKFDYRKIFITTPKVDETRQMKMAFLEALDKDISTLAELQDAELDVQEAASECANETFDKAVKNYEIEHQDEITAQALEKNRPLSQYPRLGIYDCKNRKLMDQMLCDAFAYLRKNPKFVLAQLPDSYKLPILREWIAHRYGKEYTPKERANNYRLSCKIFRALDKMNFDFNMPNANQMGRNQTVNYNCWKYLNKKCKHIKDEYYRRLDNAFMEHTRIFWFVTRAYVCSNGPPRKVFYAYMPSRFQDIQHFRLWKSSEFRNYKGAWTKRQRAKIREQFSG